MRKLTIATLAATAALTLIACGDDEDPTPARPAAAAAAEPAHDVGYTPVSDVAPHGAIGKDLAEVRKILEPAADGKDADFAAAGKVFTDGANSKKSDGSMRTLAGFVEDDPVATRVTDAAAGSGTAADLDVAARRQWIDKGMTVSLAKKVIGELDAAAEKITAGETDSAEGAPHNVDEAWAFFDAEGEGVAATAKKRAADYGLGETDLADAVLTALAKAQKAAGAGDATAFTAAREETRGALNRIFALAVRKYAHEGAKDPVARQEGLAFTWGLQGDLPDAARTTLEGAFAPDADADAIEAASAALDDHAGVLGYSAPLPEYPEA